MRRCRELERLGGWGSSERVLKGSTTDRLISFLYTLSVMAICGSVSLALAAGAAAVHRKAAPNFVDYCFVGFIIRVGAAGKDQIIVGDVVGYSKLGPRCYTFLCYGREIRHVRV